jgi:tetratricopeptide (TPR) repeat protein
MKRFLGILFLFLSFAAAAQVASVNELWQKGNTAYGQKQYDSAAALYEQVVKQQPTAISYYNLGNAYYRANKIGPAVLNYERALRLKPDFKEAADNLLLTQNRIGNRVQQGQDIFFVRWWQTLTKGSSANTWAVVNLLALLLLLGAFLYRRFRNPSWLRPQITGGLVAVWLVVLIIAVQSAANAGSHDKAIVMQPDTLLTTDQSSKTQSLLPEGTKVTVLHKKGGRTEVKLGDGRTGWVQDAAIAVI